MSSLDMKKGNVANQREHLILLLANIDIRNKNPQVPKQVICFAVEKYLYYSDYNVISNFY